MNSNLSTRIITGIIFIIVMMCGVFLHPYSCFVLFALVAALAVWEYEGLIQQYPSTLANLPFAPIEKTIVTAMGTLLYGLIGGVCLGILPIISLVFALPMCLLLFVRELYDKKDNPYLRVGLHFIALIYIVLPFALTNRIVTLDADNSTILGNNFVPLRLVGLMLLVWSNDTFAYFSGRFFGKTPFFHSISPKKTREGFIGGLLGTLIVGMAMGFLFRSAFPPLVWYGLAIIATVIGTWGDLVESLLKRSLGVKDSGNILPGHGGILDRFDALLFVLPFAWAWIEVYFWWMQP